MENIEKISIDKNNKGIRPVSMFILYSGYKHFIEVADIDKDLNVTNSKPMTKDTLVKLNRFITDNVINQDIFKFEKEILPKNLIYYDGIDNIIWYEKAAKRKLILKFGDTFEYNIPLIVFRLKNGKLSIYISDTNIIKNDMKIYASVFPNMYNDDNICIGNNKPGEFSYISEVIKYYTDFFFESEFTADFPGHSKQYFIQARTEKFPKEFFKKNNYKLLKEIL